MCVLTLSLLGMASSYGQKKSSVIITGNNIFAGSKFEIETVKPDYEVEKKELNEKVIPFFAAIKKEIDFWLNEGYELEDVTANTIGTGWERMMFVLIKEE